MNRIETDREIQIPNGAKAVTAKYRDHKLSEYNNNPIIQALPPISSPAEFLDYVTRLPKFSPEEKEFEPHYRFHCIERLSRYFDPQTNSIELHKLICVLLMQGYLGRNPLKPSYAQRSRQIYEALKAKDGKSLENYVTVPSSASGLTLIGPSGIGKTTNLINILEFNTPDIFLNGSTRLSEFMVQGSSYFFKVSSASDLKKKILSTAE